MSVYSTYIFPFVMDLAMRSDPFKSLRRELLKHTYGNVLEIGSGTGLNFPEYPLTIENLETVDPSAGMGFKAQKRAAKLTFPVEHHEISAENLPFDNDHFDFVISTWTMCSIPDLNSALSEIKRVLKPDGEFKFIEHGLSPNSSVQKWQHRLTPIQKCIAGGCHLNRDITAEIEDADLTIKDLQRFYIKNTPRFVGYIFQGTAVKL